MYTITQNFLKPKRHILAKNNGFTLAEVLITLAIIGIVASLTIPTLMKSYEKAQIVAGVKKYTSVASQALKMYAVDNNCVGDLTVCGIFAVNVEQAWNELSPYFKLAKDCGIESGEGCLAPGVTYKWLDGSNSHLYDDNARGKGILNDGASIMIYDSDGNCSTDASHSDTNPLLNACGSINIDINGHKGPNQWGKDFFGWWVTRSGEVYPQGISDDSRYADGTTREPDCDPNGSAGGENAGGGIGCAGYIMTKGNANYLD